MAAFEMPVESGPVHAASMEDRLVATLFETADEIAQHRLLR